MLLKVSFLILFLFTARFLPAQTGSFQYDGKLREYLLHLPPSFSDADTLPLVFCLHGLFQSNNRISEVAELNPIADREGFIVCYPLGVDTAWNSFGNPNSGTDDVGFLSALIDTLHQQYHINLERVYSTGMSNGGFMSYSLACMLSDRIAAIASVAGSTTDSMIQYCQPLHSMPIMEIHGDADWVVNYNGGFVGIGAGSNSIDSTLLYWRSQNNCSSSPSITQLPDVDNTDNCTVTKYHWTQCDESEIVHYKVNDGGHTWPGSAVDFDGLGGNVNHDFEASEAIWEFFSRYALQGKMATALEVVTEQGVHFYPNPVEENLIVELNGDIPFSRIFLTDISGKILKTTLTENSGSVALSLAQIPAGMYLLTVEGAGKIITRKIVRK